MVFSPFLGWGGIPPFYPGSLPAERDACRRFDLSDPVSQVGRMVYDERGAVLGKDVFEESVEKYIPVRFLHRLAVIPRRRTNKPVIRSLIPSVEEGVAVAALQATERFDAFHNVFYGDPFGEVVKQSVAEGFKTNRRKHDPYSLALPEGKDVRKVGGKNVDVVDPANKIDL